VNRYRPQRNWGARVLEYRYQGMRAVSLENELLRVGVLADKGTDVFEFNYKPRDMDFVWLTADDVRNPTSYLSTSPDPLATFMDYYPGGWQEIFPNGGAPSSYLGAQFGQHGEVSNLPWDYEITQKGLGLRVGWDAEQMPYLWFWQEYGASGFYPWHGRHYHIGLEPFSSFPTNGLKEAVDNGTALTLGARERRRFSLRAEVIEGAPDSRGVRG
jgi:hypothetical protein